MFRRLLRLILVVLPGFVVVVAWVVWWLCPERPIHEWQLHGPFNQTWVRITPESGQTQFATAGHIEYDSPLNTPANQVYGAWHLDLTTGHFKPLSDDHPITKGIGISEGPLARYRIETGDKEWTLIDELTGSVVIRRPFWFYMSFEGPSISPTGAWIAIGESWYERRSSIEQFVAETTGLFSGSSQHNRRLLVFEASTGRLLNLIPSWSTAHWSPNGNEFWTVDRMHAPKGFSTGVTFRLWSVHSAWPPWWLWLLTVTGVGTSCYNLRRLALFFRKA